MIVDRTLWLKIFTKLLLICWNRFCRKYGYIGIGLQLQQKAFKSIGLESVVWFSVLDSWLKRILQLFINTIKKIIICFEFWSKRDIISHRYSIYYDFFFQSHDHFFLVILNLSLYFSLVMNLNSKMGLDIFFLFK